MKEIIKILAADNEPKFNLSKLAEECFELGEVVMKMVNKSKEHRPPIEKLIEEAGDVKLRISIILEQYGIKEEVKQRMIDKSLELEQYHTKKMYVGGI